METPEVLGNGNLAIFHEKLLETPLAFGGENLTIFMEM